MAKLTRRDFLLASAASIGSIVISTSLSGCSSDNDNPEPLPYDVAFLHGVASGDPTTDALLLWTRISAEETEVPLEW